MQGYQGAHAVAQRHDFGGVLATALSDGSAAHPYLQSLMSDRSEQSSRNLSDAIHFVSLLHGRHPGVLDHATWRAPDDGTRERLEMLAGWFDRERALLTRLVVAVGPMPGTPGQAQSESAVVAQRNALTTLARSERPGCAIGACVALIADWNAIRPLLDLVADRWTVPAGNHLDVQSECRPLVDPLLETPRERALMFGLDQVLQQHRGLWDLLEARRAARNAL